jgi:hypothetical protein
MKLLKKSLPVLTAGVLAAGILGGGSASADELNKEQVIKAGETGPQMIPVDEGGHSWSYVTKKTHASGYYYVYEDFDTYYHYIKNVYYDKSGRYLETKYYKFHR